jgi:glutaconate CoA-transferase, subunit B
LTDYRPDELMVVEAARHITDGDVVLVGTGLPMVAGLLAQRTHAPNMCYVVETGPVAPRVLPTPISVSDPRVMHEAVSHGSLLSSLGGVLQRGLADVSFLGGAQIDRYANLNSTVIGDPEKPKVRLPGSGGANDLASHSPRILIITRHERRRFPERCDYITSPGYLDGPDARKLAGLSVPYPEISVITDLCVMEIDRATGTLGVARLAPGVAFEEVQEKTGFDLIRPDDIPDIETPSGDIVELLRREVDPDGVYLKG